MNRTQSAGNALVDSAIRQTMRRVPERSTPTRVYTSATAEFTVNHDLGVIPKTFGYLPWADLTIWATEDQQRQWTDRILVLTASAAGDATVWGETW